MALDALQVLRLVVLEEDRQEDGVIAAHGIRPRRSSPSKSWAACTPRLTPLPAMIPCSYSNARFKTQKAEGAQRMTDLHSRLMHQALGRPLTAEERALADALEAVFRTGEQDFEAVARALEGGGV